MKLAPAPERRMPKISAYEAYLRYRSYQWQFTPEATRRSRECLEQAVALDPEFALPYVGLADSYLALAAVGAIPSHEAMPRARDLATRALEIDPDLPEAHAMLGIVAGLYDFDWGEVERRFRAAKREQMSPHLRQWHAMFHLHSIGRFDEAMIEHRQILDEDPLCQMWRYTAATTMGALGLDDEALESLQKAVELDPDFWVGWMWLGILHAVRGQIKEALPCAEKACSGAPWAPYALGLMAGVLSQAKRGAEADSYLARLGEADYGGAAVRAVYHLTRHEVGQMLEWAGRAVDTRYTGILPMTLRSFQPTLQRSTAWPPLLKKLNLPA